MVEEEGKSAWLVLRNEKQSKITKWSSHSAEGKHRPAAKFSCATERDPSRVAPRKVSRPPALHGSGVAGGHKSTAGTKRPSLKHTATDGNVPFPLFIQPCQRGEDLKSNFDISDNDCFRTLSPPTEKKNLLPATMGPQHAQHFLLHLLILAASSGAYHLLALSPIPC